MQTNQLEYWMTEPVMATSDAGLINLADLKVEDISVEDISCSLNSIRRFLGHGDLEPLTVAQHTMLVMNLITHPKYGLQTDKHSLREVLKYALVHDFPEAYYGDVPTPIKRLLGPAFAEFANKIDFVVFDALWDSPSVDQSIKDVVKYYDYMSLKLELSVLFEDAMDYSDLEVDEEDRLTLWEEVAKKGDVPLDRMYRVFFTE